VARADDVELFSSAELPLAEEVDEFRRMPIGAEPHPQGGVHFRVWAPRCRRVTVEIDGMPQISLEAQGEGYFAGSVPVAAVGMQYGFRLDDGETRYPDPASRFQPAGPHGPSEIVDPGLFAWSDAGWRGRPREEFIIYELHIGTFTPHGNWVAAAGELAALADLGITCIEIMPVAEFPGRFGWGYDGVNFFAPTHLYGRPDDFRAFVDQAHRLGIAIILDVVYNHFGPDGNYLKCFSDMYFTDRYENEWGQAINFDGPDSGPVREFFLTNARYWIEEYHLDGLRLDATQQIFDSSEDHIIAAVTRQVRNAASARRTFVVAENEAQQARLARPPERAGFGLDALWNDDFHHSAMVAMTGRREAYYTDYGGHPREFVAAAKHGFLYQGQWYQWQKQRRGAPALDLPAESFVVFLQNHDQIANSRAGQRCHALTSPGVFRALTAYLLLMPGIPMLFQGQEFAASTPFFYFADYEHDPELSGKIYEGRGEFLAQFPSIASEGSVEILPDPGDFATFRNSVLDLTEREQHVGAYKLHRDLLDLRRNDPVLSRRPCRIDGTPIAHKAWLLRYFAEDGADRVLLVNLGVDVTLAPLPEPLLAPTEGALWRVLWSSEATRYGGGGVPPLYRDDNLHIPGQSALVLAPMLIEDPADSAVGHG
jgi:maltooligosyltrehalose trehalohydrolase